MYCAAQTDFRPKLINAAHFNIIHFIIVILMVFSNQKADVI